MKIYYIYHIPDIKIGCSTYPKIRVERQGYTNYEILETHTDINIASKREIELQKQYGYRIDSTSYKQTYDWGKAGRKAHTKENYQKWQDGSTKWKNENKDLVKKYATMGGKVTGKQLAKRNVESGHISKLGKLNANRVYTCPHCGKVGKSSGMFTWHFDRCRNKIVI